MKGMKILALVIVVAVAAVAIPADKPDKAPELSAEQKVLDQFLGDWRGQEKAVKAKWNPEEKRTTSTGASVRILGGRFTSSEGKTSDGTTSLTLMTYDQQKKAYRMWYFNSRGFAGESAGQWDAKTKTLTLRSDGDDGTTTTGKLRIVDGDTVEWNWTTKDAEGAVGFRIEGKNTRVKPSKKKLRD